jgi:hypothetical protein
MTAPKLTRPERICSAAAIRAENRASEFELLAEAEPLPDAHNFVIGLSRSIIEN